MNLVDSSGWIEYFSGGKNANFFAPAIEDVKKLIIPAICFYEVFKKVLQQKSEGEALQVAAAMQQGQVIALAEVLALQAAKLSFDLKLPMAESIILATAYQHQATIWTQDTDFKNIKGVKFVEAR